ncbi:MAG: calcium-binding protein, partial [Rhodobacteraceae bacterium]|nr:calcium-binding protein [Paracoccaceae bacterium]
MATTIISTNQTTTQTLSTGDELVLLDGVSIAVTGAFAITGTGATTNDLNVIIAGDIFSTTRGIDLSSDSVGDGTGIGDHNIHIAATGSVASFSQDAVSLQGSDNFMTNLGEISTFDVNNSGVTNWGDNFSLRNYGSIFGGYGVYVDNAAAVVSDTNIVNDGVIQGVNNGVRANDVSLELFNTGLISGANDNGSSIGVFVRDSNGTTGSYIHNSGTISGGFYSIKINYNDNVVNNSGLLIGDVVFGTGNDTYDGRGGTVNGTVLGGAGDDTYIIDDATIALSENAVEGTDTVQSTVGWTLGDNFENLTLIGSSHVDGYGNVENNLLTGNDGDNKLNGRGGADTLYGKAGDDRIEGGNGIDILFGGDGDDKL